MAALTFPANPATQTPSNTFSPTSTPSATTNGATYIWDGSAWTVFGGGSATAYSAKGDLIVGTGVDTDAILPVGADNTVLTADSTTTTGTKWAASSGGGAGLQDVFLLMGA